MTGGHDVGDVFWIAEDACAPARRSQWTAYGWLRWVSETQWVRAIRRGALSARGGAHRALHARTRRNIGQHGFVGLLTPFANLPLSAAKRRAAQPPYDFTAPGVTANILKQSASTKAVAHQRFRMLARRSSSSTGDGCENIAAQQKRPSDFIPKMQTTCWRHLAKTLVDGTQRACATIFWIVPASAASAPLKS